MAQRCTAHLGPFNFRLFRWLGCALLRSLLTSLHTTRDEPWCLLVCRSIVCCAQATALSTWFAGVAACMWSCECRHSPGVRQTCHSPHAESAHIHTHAVDEAAAQRARLDVAVIIFTKPWPWPLIVYLGWVDKYVYLLCISCVFSNYFKMVKYMGTATSGTLPRHPYF